MFAQNEISVKEKLTNETDNRAVWDKHRKWRILAQNK